MKKGFKKRLQMPIVGFGSADRASAHMRWAERYVRHNNVPKATAHLGRALEYERRACSLQSHTKWFLDLRLLLTVHPRNTTRKKKQSPYKAKRRGSSNSASLGYRETAHKAIGRAPRGTVISATIGSRSSAK